MAAREYREYGRVVRCISRPAEERTRRELQELERWFRNKSKLLKGLKQETLLDVIQHCEFITKQKDEVIIHQGEIGHRMYILLRGMVSVLQKESLEDVDLGEEGHNSKVDRQTLGNHLVTLKEGSIFGELALINADCIRTASIVAEDRVDLVVIHRNLYNRSVSKVVAREYEEKIEFIDSLPLIQQWMPKFRRQLAASFRREVLPFDCVLFKQGDPSTDMYFIVKGEIKLTVDPEAHFQQFERFMKKCGDVMDGDEEKNQSEKAYFPQRLLPQLAKYTRVNKAQIGRRPGTAGGGGERPSPSGGLRQLPQTWSPSAIRKMNAEIHSRKVNISLCYLGERQCVGDVEAMLGLDLYHASALCSQETVVMVLQRSHFDRLFKRRNAKTVAGMAQMLELQLTRRVLKPNIVECAPLLKCFVYRLQQAYGERQAVVEGVLGEPVSFTMPDMVYESSDISKNGSGGGSGENGRNHRVKTYTWSLAARSHVPAYTGGRPGTPESRPGSRTGFARSKTMYGGSTFSMSSGTSATTLAAS